MKTAISNKLILRWSYTVPILSYVIFFILIWTLSVPLKSNKDIYLKASQESFEIRMKNSNFNSDKKEDMDNNNKDEYLIHINNENRRKTQNEILMEVFFKADKDHNSQLDSKELSQWIRNKIIEHITSAISNNFELFSQIDTNPRNGVVTWKEYHSYFLKKRGFSKKYIQRHDEKRHKGLQRTIKEQIMRDKASWMEAAKTNPEALTLDEFLAFTHPESSAANQLVLVDELYEKFDRDGDEFLTEDEFAVLQTEGKDDEPVLVRQDENQRRAEFRLVIDVNGDGRADRRELLRYVAPQSPRHSEHEAEALLGLADMDHDHMLSIDEILTHPDLFLNSKMVDTARSFHDEF